jgi:hypothetical protein
MADNLLSNFQVKAPDGHWSCRSKLPSLRFNNYVVLERKGKSEELEDYIFAADEARKRTHVVPYPVF